MKKDWRRTRDSVQFSSVAQLCPTLCDPMDCSTPGLPFYHQLLDFMQTHVHWVGDAIQPSYPLLSPSPPAFNLSLARLKKATRRGLTWRWGGACSKDVPCTVHHTLKVSLDSLTTQVGWGPTMDGAIYCGGFSTGWCIEEAHYKPRD